MATLTSDLKNKFKYGSVVIKFIFINIALFLFLRIAGIVCTFSNADFNWLLQFIECPSDLGSLIIKPWTIFTYMFAQVEIFHIIFNMLWLYWFGSIFLLVCTSRQMIALYIYGGLLGAIAYIAAYNLLPYFNGIQGQLIGSSASVIAIVVATAMRCPDYKMNLLFIGPVSLKWIACITIIIDLISITDSNAGGHIAHLGGAIAGFIFAMMLSKGYDITKGFNNTIDTIVNQWNRLKDNIRRQKLSSSKIKSSEQNQASNNSKSDSDTLDEILDKIKKSGYTSLTAEEKKRLFDVSRRIK